MSEHGDPTRPGPYPHTGGRLPRRYETVITPEGPGHVTGFDRDREGSVTGVVVALKGAGHANKLPHFRLPDVRLLTPEEADWDKRGTLANEWATRHRVERIGSTSGRKVNYQLKVGGRSVGRIERKRVGDYMIAGPRTSHMVWFAKRSPYDTGSSFKTAEDAERFLIDWQRQDAAS